MEPASIVEVFTETVNKYGNRNAIAYKHYNKWCHMTWDDYYNQSLIFAHGLVNLGLKRGEGVCIMGFNSPEWLISNMAAIMAGGISVGLYTTNSVETCQFIINDSNSTIIIVENEEYLQRILQIPEQYRSHIKAIIQYRGDIFVSDDNVYTWCQFITMSYRFFYAHFNHHVLPNTSKDVANHCATLIYTSGTTGHPKGVMLSHDNIIWTAKTVLNTLGVSSRSPQSVVSYLPLSHVAGQMIDIYMPIVNGGEVWCASPDALKGSLIDTLKEVQPTIFLGVPRVWEKIKDKMEEKSSQLSESKQFISTMAKKIGLQHIERGKKFHSLQWRLCRSLVYSKVKKELGLSKCRLFFSGAAPISIDVLKYFVSLDIPIFDIFGMSESSGCISFNYNSRYKLGSSGVKLHQTEVCIDPVTSEIFTRGRHVMLGYLNNQEQTWETIAQNKWLHTGDIGYLDSEGFLYITGRSKELLITSGGENIPPRIIEDNIKFELPIISNCMVVGDNRKYLTVLITLKCIFDTNNTPTDNLDHHTISVLSRLGYNAIKVSGLIDDPIFMDYIVEGIVRANKKSISHVQQVKKFRILPCDFSIVGGELGPTMKLRRLKVVEKYQSLIDEMYDEDKN